MSVMEKTNPNQYRNFTNIHMDLHAVGWGVKKNLAIQVIFTKWHTRVSDNKVLKLMSFLSPQGCLCQKNSHDSRLACACTDRCKTDATTLNKIRRYRMPAVSGLCNCSCNLARLNIGVTLSQGSSTWRPLSSSRWKNCMSLYWRIDSLASHSWKFSLPSIKASQIPSPRPSMKVCSAS